MVCIGLHSRMSFVELLLRIEEELALPRGLSKTTFLTVDTS
eukprot:COSAG02_NODE_5583_length_4212_cov_2.972296_2_plen_41_part_00